MANTSTCNGRRPALSMDWEMGDRVESVEWRLEASVDDMPVTAGLIAIQKLARQTLHKIINTI